MVATLIGFGLAFMLGMTLLMVGLMGDSFADCPALLVQFPAVKMQCNWFMACTGLGLLLGLVGLIGGIGMMGCAELWPEGRIGQGLSWSGRK